MKGGGKNMISPEASQVLRPGYQRLWTASEPEGVGFEQDWRQNYNEDQTQKEPKVSTPQE